MNLQIKDLEQFEETVKNAFGDTTDLIIKPINVGMKQGIIAYLSSMTDSSLLAEKILDPLTQLPKENVKEGDTLEQIGTQLFSSSYDTFLLSDDLLKNITNGHVTIYIEGLQGFLSIIIGVSDKRSVEEPSSQTVVRGPKDGFVEDVQTNITLLRKKIKSPDLRFESYTLGEDTSTMTYIAYMNNITNSKILNEVRKRIKDIQTEAVFDSSNIDEFIRDKALTPFPLIYNSERPDKIASDLTEGKVVVLVDGSPFVLSMPCTLNDYMSVSSDYYHHFFMGTFLRLIRYFAFLISVFLPSIYVAVITFHHEMLPTQLLISVISQREGIPFPAVVEALLMEISFEILREAGVRMPRAVGGTISIVGGLVIGQAAVEAGLVSNFMVIVIALTAISSFVSPVYAFSSAARLIRFIVLFMAATFGLYGVLIFMIILVGHLASLRSFGVSYLAPVAPLNLNDQKDIFFRAPYWMMSKRPSYLKTKQTKKQPSEQSPNQEGSNDQ